MIIISQICHCKLVGDFYQLVAHMHDLILADASFAHQRSQKTVLIKTVHQTSHILQVLQCLYLAPIIRHMVF